MRISPVVTKKSPSRSAFMTGVIVVVGSRRLVDLQIVHREIGVGVVLGSLSIGIDVGDDAASGCTPVFAYRLFIVSTASKQRHSHIRVFRVVLPHARLERHAEVPIVLHVHGLSKIMSGYPVVPFVRGCA